jgi:hypothetical protein
LKIPGIETVETGYASRSIKKLGGFCGSLYRDSLCFLGSCYANGAEKLEKRGGYKIALVAMPIGIGAYAASFWADNPTICDLLNNLSFGAIGAGAVSFAEEYMSGNERMRERKQMERDMKRLQNEAETQRKQNEGNEELLRKLLREERKQTKILKDEFLAA